MNCSSCICTHSQNGKNYEWLHALNHGSLVNVWYEEPPNSGKWRIYTDDVWKIHCDVVDHGENLFEAHMKAFVDESTRFAKLLFLFEDGSLLHPNSEFYTLESDYFRNNIHKK